jgi:hypothetical protein
VLALPDIFPCKYRTYYGICCKDLGQTLGPQVAARTHSKRRLSLIVLLSELPKLILRRKKNVLKIQFHQLSMRYHVALLLTCDDSSCTWHLNRKLTNIRNLSHGYFLLSTTLSNLIFTLSPTSDRAQYITSYNYRSFLPKISDLNYGINW